MSATSTVGRGPAPTSPRPATACCAAPRGSEFWDRRCRPAGAGPGDGGTARVSGSKLTVDGARRHLRRRQRRLPEQFHLAPGTSLGFVATFTGDPYQHSGLTDLESSFEPMALFSAS
jgi:hypothetical protein